MTIPDLEEMGMGGGALRPSGSVPTEGHGTAVVAVPRDQLETLKRSLELNNLLPGEGASLIGLWLLIADAEAKS